MCNLDSLLLRFILPLILFAVTAARYNGFSFIYLIFLLACPLLPLPDAKRRKLKIQIFLISLITLSCIFTLSHPTLHIILAVAPPYDDALKTCGEIVIASQVGVQRLNGMVFYRALRLVLPDMVTLAAAVGLLVYVSRRGNRAFMRNLSANVRSTEENGAQCIPHDLPDLSQFNEPAVSRKRSAFGAFDSPKNSDANVSANPVQKAWDDNRKNLWRAWAVDVVFMIVNVFLICMTGIISPSFPSFIYLSSFLGVCTYWACQRQINPAAFAYLRMFLLVYSGLHVCVYYVYQFPMFQSFCRDGEFWARFLGLYYIMRTSCDKPGEIMFPPTVRTVDCIAPPLTMLLYHSLVFETRRWMGLSTRRVDYCRNTNNPNVSTVDEHSNLLEVATEAVSPVECANVHENIQGSSSSTNSVKIVSRDPGAFSADEFTSESQHHFSLPAHVQSFVTSDKSCLDSVTLNTPNRNSSPKTTNAVFKASDLNSDEVALLNSAGTFESIQERSQSNPDLATVLRSAVKHQSNHRSRVQPDPISVVHQFNMENNNSVRTERPLLLSLHFSAIRNSYIVTLIAMMAWAVTYRSWLSFILLLSACILWIVPNSRLACLYASPVIVGYAIVLILIQYVYGMNLTNGELPQEVTSNGLKLSELGMRKWQNSVAALSLQISFLICFWLTLRLFVNERSAKSTNPPNLASFHTVDPSHLSASPWRRLLGPSFAHLGSPPPVLHPLSAVGNAWHNSYLPFGNVDNSSYRKFTEFLHGFCVKYWIVVCCLSMLLISIQQPVVIFRIFYMAMLIYFMLTFQVSFRFWRRQMIFFWWFIVVYSMAILLCIYTYQFQGSPEFWQRTTGLSEAVLKDIGLETFASTALFQRLLTPVVFLVIIILQVHYYHEPFLNRSALERFSVSQNPDAATSPFTALLAHRTGRSLSTASSLSNFIEDVNSAFQLIVTKVTHWLTNLNACFWRILEVHWMKLIGLLTMFYVVNDVCAPNMITVILLIFCFPFPSAHGFMTVVIFLWTGLLTLCRMCFQLHFVQYNITRDCEISPNASTYYRTTTWFGFTKVDNFSQYVMPLGVLMTVCVSWQAIGYRQMQFYNNPHHVRPQDGTVFPSVTFHSFDKNLWTVVMFAVNYGFYKFGLEIFFCTVVITACLRVDAFSVLYLLLAVVFLFTPRLVCAKLWLPYMLFLAALIPIQYASCVGLPPILCLSYPWVTDSRQVDNFLRWLFLPGAYGSPTAQKLVADFFQFAVVAFQYRVFRIELSPNSSTYSGGSNKPIIINTLPGKNDRDFVSSKESYLDYLLHLIFYWSYWVSLAVVLATGVIWINLFCLGYMSVSFMYLWLGQNIMLRKRSFLLTSWNVIIGYNFFVILTKCSLQILGCITWSVITRHCWIIQLLGIQCMDPMSWSHFDPPEYGKECTSESSGLHWDVVCFVFIIFQRKVFMMQSFSHVVFDLNVQSQFASRGAYLINKKLMMIISEQVLKEQMLLKKIREKLDAIQARQAALGRNTANITEHYIMLRSGDYYLFEGDPEQDDEKPSKLDSQNDSNGKKGKKNPSHVSGSKGAKRNPVVFSKHQNDGTRNLRGVSHLSPTHILPYGSFDQMTSTAPSFLPTTGLANPPTSHLTRTIPNLDSSVLKVLSNYTDPYSTQRPDDRGANNNLLLMNANQAGANLPTTYADGRTFGHRRMRSHPEYSRVHPSSPVRLNFSSDVPLAQFYSEQPDLIAFSSHGTLRTVRTSPLRLVEHDINRPIGRRPDGLLTVTDSGVRRKTHRRIVSASSALTPNVAQFSSAVPTQTVTTRSSRHHRPAFAWSTLQTNEDVARPGRKISLSSRSAILHEDELKNAGLLDSAPAILGSPRATLGVGRNYSSQQLAADTYQVHMDSADDEGEPADWDSEFADDDDEFDDANPASSSASRLNPLQLLNRAMECGAHSVVRQFRRSLLSQTSPQEGSHVLSTRDPPPSLPCSHVPLTELSNYNSSVPQRPSSMQHFSSQRNPGLCAPKHHLSQYQSGPSVLSRPDAEAINQSNRGWSLSRKQPPQKLCSLASVEGEDDLSESMFNVRGETLSSATDSHSKPAHMESTSKIPTVSRRCPDRSAYSALPVKEGRLGRLHRSKVPVSSVNHQASSRMCDDLDSAPVKVEPLSFEQTAAARVVRLRSHVSSATTSISAECNGPANDGGDESPTKDGELSLNVSSHPQEGCWSNFKASCLVVYMFFVSSIDSLIRFLNGLTKQYRRIRRTIEQEKSTVKRNVIDNSERSEQSHLDIEVAVYKVVSKSPEHRHSTFWTPPDGTLQFTDHILDAPLELSEEADRYQHDQREKAFRRSRSRAFLLLIALGNLSIVYSEWFCYFLLILNQMQTSALLSLPYPLAVFLWGMLSVPRPTKTFWTFLITYTEIVIVIKYIFQSKFIHFNDPAEFPSEAAESLWYPRMLGVDKHQNYALFDLIQLIALFLHRGFLKNDGLWRDHTEFAHDLQLVAQNAKPTSSLGKINPKNSSGTADEFENPLTVVDTNSQNPSCLPSNSFPISLPLRNPASSWNPFVKLRRFYNKMTDPRYNKKVDVYIYMFICEFISFWIMIFGYVSFGPSTGMGDNAFEFIKSNRIPLPFISMLLLQFIFIIVDRGLFLRRQVLGKFIFQIFHVVLIHGWLFFILPYITKQRFTAGFAPQSLYLIKCVYFSLSAYQIRSGYPLRILGNFLTKNYNYINLILFKGYLIIPFLYELRNVMDWMWTNSALSLYHWMELEDIYCKIFVLKCWRRSEIAYPTPRGVNRAAWKKSLYGGLLLAFFFICFWGPMTLSSFIDVTFDFNPPVLCVFSVSFGGFPPIFEFDSREGNILNVDQRVLHDFIRCHEKDQQTVGFLNNFESKDIRYVTIDGYSGNLWAITPPSYDALLASLADPRSDLLLHFHMHCRRLTKEIQTSQTSVGDIFSRKLERAEKEQLLNILKNSGVGSETEEKAVTLNAAMPRYVLLRKDRLRTAFAKLGTLETYVNVSFSLRRGTIETQSWWELRELPASPAADNCFEILRKSTLRTLDSVPNVLSVVTFNERVSDSLFGKVFTNYGIIGMYAAYIFLANRLLRTIYSNISYVICLEELPHVDRILNLCNEIYLVRENKLLLLEEQLAAKLFFLYRSSETMIKWTRHPKHIIDQFTGPLTPANQEPQTPDRLSRDPRDRSGSNQYPDSLALLSPRSVPRPPRNGSRGIVSVYARNNVTETPSRVAISGRLSRPNALFSQPERRSDML